MCKIITLRLDKLHFVLVFQFQTDYWFSTVYFMSTKFLCCQSVLRYDKFDSISLHLPEPNNQNMHTLNQLLNNFVKNEMINDITCEGCNKNRAPNSEIITAPAIKLLRFGKVRIKIIQLPNHFLLRWWNNIYFNFVQNSYQLAYVFTLCVLHFTNMAYIRGKITLIFQNTLLWTHIYTNPRKMWVTLFITIGLLYAWTFSCDFVNDLVVIKGMLY